MSYSSQSPHFKRLIERPRVGSRLTSPTVLMQPYHIFRVYDCRCQSRLQIGFPTSYIHNGMPRLTTRQGLLDDRSASSRIKPRETWYCLTDPAFLPQSWILLCWLLALCCLEQNRKVFSLQFCSAHLRYKQGQCGSSNVPQMMARLSQRRVPRWQKALMERTWSLRQMPLRQSS